MNILFLSCNSSYTEGFFGGAEFSMKILAEQLAKLGHNIVYITRNQQRGLWPKYRQYLINNVDVYILHLLRGPGRFSRFIPISGFINRINDYLCMVLISRIINTKNIQIVYVFYEIEIIRLLLKIHNDNFKIIMRMAGMFWYEECLKSPKLVHTWEYIFNQIDAVNYVTAGLDKMIEDKLQELNMQVAFKHKFNADIGTALANTWINNNSLQGFKEFTVVMASRFSKYQKRQDILIKAASHIKVDLKITLKLIGSGWEKRDILEMIEQLQVSDRIKLIPFMKQEELWNELVNADLLCHACEYEGTSKIILESMALGLPVLASNVVPLSDYITEGYNGFLVNNDPVLWAKKIEALIENEPLRQQVSQNAREYINKYHNPEKNVKLYESEFCKILQG